jgi:hypothetical protein
VVMLWHQKGAAGKGYCILRWLNLFLHCGGWFGSLWHWIRHFSGKWSDKVWGF